MCAFLLKAPIIEKNNEQVIEIISIIYVLLAMNNFDGYFPKVHNNNENITLHDFITIIIYIYIYIERIINYLKMFQECKNKQFRESK